MKHVQYLPDANPMASPLDLSFGSLLWIYHLDPHPSPTLPHTEERLSALMRAAEELYSDQQQAVHSGMGHTRAVGACLGMPESGPLVGSAVIYERVGEILAGWLTTGGEV